MRLCRIGLWTVWFSVLKFGDYWFEIIISSYQLKDLVMKWNSDIANWLYIHMKFYYTLTVRSLIDTQRWRHVIYWQSDWNRYPANITYEQMVALFFLFYPKVKAAIFDPQYRGWNPYGHSTCGKQGEEFYPSPAGLNRWCINDNDNSQFGFNLAWRPKAQQHLTTAAPNQALI